MRLIYLSLLLGLPACMIIGDPKDPNESATAGPDVTSTPATTGTATTEADPTTGITTGLTTGPTTGDLTSDITVGDATSGPACDGLDEVACAEEPGCNAVFGDPLDFPGCTSSPALLGCIEATDCGLMPTVVCRDNSLEVYVLGDTCVPPDYTVCDSMLPACPDACEGLGEGECAAAPGCVGHFGAPHLEQGDMTCVDYNNLEFLACDAAHPPCPPVVLTVCPQGQPDVAFDVGSGCVPPGFEVCGDEPVPDCR